MKFLVKLKKLINWDIERWRLPPRKPKPKKPTNQ